MTISFSQQIFNRVEPLWQSYLTHPFVKGIGDGTLDKAKFIHYMKQDYIYLIDYSRLFAIGASKANDLSTMTLFGELLHGTLSFEMDLHRQYAAKFGISAEELEATEPSATMTSYTSYMLSQASLGGVENTIAAVLACAWSYNYIGKALAENPASKEHEFYGDWVNTYSSPEFTKLVNKCIQLIDKIGGTASPEAKKKLEDIVVNTSYYEYMFWDMAENISMWDVPVTV